MPNSGLLPDLDMQPRVYVRKLGGEYVEIAGVTSYTRDDHESSGGEISFIVADEQDNALSQILLNTSDKYVDVKMEFSIGMLMVMTFSGFVENYSGNTISIAVSTPMTTNVLESAEATIH